MHPTRSDLNTNWKATIATGWTLETDGPRTTAIFLPGEYFFRAIAANNDGVWSETGQRLWLFDLAPHVYQTYWFFGLSSCVAGLLVYGCAQASESGTSSDVNSDWKQLVESRTAELHKQKTFLRSIIDLNPSFIFAKDRQGRFTLANRALADVYGGVQKNLSGSQN